MPSKSKKQKSYLNTSRNFMTLFHTTYCCIFTSQNLPSYCKDLKCYCINKSLTLGKQVYEDEHSIILVTSDHDLANGQQLHENSLVPSIVGKDEVIIHKWLVEDISKLSKSNKGSIKGDNHNHHQYYYSCQHWHNATKDCQALQRIIYQHCHMAPLVLI